MISCINIYTNNNDRQIIIKLLKLINQLVPIKRSNYLSIKKKQTQTERDTFSLVFYVDRFADCLDT